MTGLEEDGRENGRREELRGLLPAPVRERLPPRVVLVEYRGQSSVESDNNGQERVEDQLDPIGRPTDPADDPPPQRTRDPPIVVFDHRFISPAHGGTLLSRRAWCGPRGATPAAQRTALSVQRIALIYGNKGPYGLYPSAWMTDPITGAHSNGSSTAADPVEEEPAGTATGTAWTGSAAAAPAGISNAAADNAPSHGHAPR
ncbi:MULTISPECIES: hypothetical protein [Nocardia]|uniref:hypothetical protein n=1 Tax=Nocardia TaxID=1817 RepID=UPI000FD7A31A|nr:MULTISPECIES: hypothetical protein [Nocardia]MBF6142598.1 hypothetical protein [Nocardia farcinica]MBF6186500.1 hypothetical protein [Nocardia farcinica]MBF6247032.1 hypothetical protein [Nocardia elegans]MBF6313805.1 hypothetical protein [Nocardia farcinica]MBF6385883.1 hypothetical protein [Nocardia farcinica]